MTDTNTIKISKLILLLTKQQQQIDKLTKELEELKKILTDRIREVI